MKKSLFMSFFVGLFGLSLAVAQAPNQECLTNLSIFVESAKVKNYDAAYKPWKMVYETCPDINRANYLYGERILKDKIKKSTGEEHDAFVTQLLELYDKAAQYYPKYYGVADTAIDKVLLKRSEKKISGEEHEGPKRE